MSDLHTALEAAITTVNQLRADVARLEAERDDYRRRLDFAEVTAGRVAQERDEALRLERQLAHELGLTVAERHEAWAEREEMRTKLVGALEAWEAVVADRDSWRRVCERLEGEKVAARAERDEARTQSEEARHERDLWQGEHAAALGVIEAIKAERDALRPVAEAAEAVRDQWHRMGFRPVSIAMRALLAAVDQTAPSSPLATPHTADGGEAGVVEGAGGSEAAEGVVVVRDQSSDLERQEMDDIRRWFMVVRPGSQPFEVGDQVDVYEVPVPEPTGRDIRAALVLYAEDTNA